MAILDLYSRRERAERGDYPDVYQYSVFPQELKVQAWYVIRDVLGTSKGGNTDHPWRLHQFVAEKIKREFGLVHIPGLSRNFETNMQAFFIGLTLPSQILDVIELYFHAFGIFVTKYEYYANTKDMLGIAEATADLNRRFQDHGVGFQLERSKFIRMDSAFLHSEAVKPALNVLRDPRFGGANEEFLAAHEHYRQGRNEDCLVACCKAFESTMKTICTLENWTFKSTDNARNLIAVCLEKELLPKYFEQQMTSLRTLFESGIPTVRNKEGGHGQGTSQRVVPEHYARYVLNLTATTILFLIECHAGLER